MRWYNMSILQVVIIIWAIQITGHCRNKMAAILASVGIA